MSQPIADSALQIAASGTAVASGAAAVATTMADTSVYWLGVPMPVVLAALFGASAALSFLGQLTRLQAFSAVLMGTAAGTYLPKLLGVLWDMPADVWPGVAFFSGLGAHMVLTAVFATAPGLLQSILGDLADRVRKKP